MRRGRTIPIIELYGILIVSIQVDLSDSLIRALKEDLSVELLHSGASGLVIEVSGVDLLDSFIARSIRDLAHMAKLMGAETVLAGLEAGMAVTLVEMDLSLRGVLTMLNLEAAVDHFRAIHQAQAQEDRDLAAALADDDEKTS